MDNGVMMCPKCGEEMKADARFCNHCGYINYDNEKNDFLVKYDKRAQKILKKEERKKKRKGENETGPFINPNLKKSMEYEKYTSLKDFKITTDKNLKKPAKEKSYLFKKRITDLLIVICFLGFMYYLYNMLVEKQQVYVDASNQIVEFVKKDYGNNNFKNCTKSDEYIFLFNSDTINYKYNVKLVSPYMNANYTGYVLVRKNGNDYDYYVSLTDGTFGIRETKIEELETKKVLPFYKLQTPSVTTNCK